MEGKLNSALADMEIELRKCSVDENGLVGLHHIFEQVSRKIRRFKGNEKEKRHSELSKSFFSVGNEQGKRTRIILVEITTSRRESTSEGGIVVGSRRSFPMVGIPSTLRIRGFVC